LQSLPSNYAVKGDVCGAAVEQCLVPGLVENTKLCKNYLIRIKPILSLAVCITQMEENMSDCKPVFLQEKYCKFLFFLKNVVKTVFL